MNQAHTPIATKQLCKGIAPQQRGFAKSPQVVRIERALIECTHPLTKDDLANITGYKPADVGRLLDNIRMSSRRGRIAYDMESKRQDNGWTYKLRAKTPAAKPAKTLDPTPARTRSMFEGTYNGAELRPFADRPGCNDHMQHGSRRGEVIEPYSGPKPMCVGRLAKQVAQ